MSRGVENSRTFRQKARRLDFTGPSVLGFGCRGSGATVAARSCGSAANFFTSRTLSGSRMPPLRRCHGWTYRGQISVVGVRFDGKDVSRYKVPSMTTGRDVLSTLLGRAPSSIAYMWGLGRPCCLNNARLNPSIRLGKPCKPADPFEVDPECRYLRASGVWLYIASH